MKPRVTLITSAGTFGRRLWQTDPWLTGAGLVMLAALGGAAVGLAVDQRTITGMPAWLKPAKFALSTAIYMFTLAWVFTYLPDCARTRRIVGRTTAAILVMEVAIIGLQAWRGTNDYGRSYFPSPIFTTLSRTMIVLSTGLPATASRTFGVVSAAFSNSESEAPFFASMRSRTLPFICTAYSTSSTVRRFSS